MTKLELVNNAGTPIRNSVQAGQSIPAGTKLNSQMLRDLKMTSIDLKTFRVEDKKMNERVRTIIDLANRLARAQIPLVDSATEDWVVGNAFLDGWNDFRRGRTTTKRVRSSGCSPIRSPSLV